MLSFTQLFFEKEKCENLEQCKQIMEKEVNILREEKEKLNMSVSVLETDIQKLKKNSLELSGQLEQSLESGKKKDEDLNALKISKEAIILELTSERDELKTIVTEIKVSVLKFHLCSVMI